MPPATEVVSGLVLDGRYRIGEAIGHGGMATVYRAWDAAVGREVALKLFPPAPNPDEALRYEAEIGVLAQLSHPNLVALYDAGSSPAANHVPHPFIVMELVAGPTLADLLADGPLPADRVARIGQQLAEALAHVHGALVVHRDVKPANVLLVDGAETEVPGRTVVKLADFGIARLIDADRLTLTGTTMGTAAYLSPEQANGGPVGPPTDVYALGLVLLECLTGQKAFTGTVAEVAAARLTTDPPIPEEIGAAWAALLHEMTRRDPAERITLPDAAARLGALGDVTATAELPTPPQPTRRLGAGTAQVGMAEVTAARVDVRGGRAPARGRLAGLLLTAVVVALTGAAVLLPTAREGTEVPPPVPVDGPLGTALEDLLRSVQP